MRAQASLRERSRESTKKTTTKNGRVLAGFFTRSSRRLSTKPEAFVDPWGVTDAEYTTLEANLFAASLFPYLFFLFFLGKPETAFSKRGSVWL